METASNASSSVELSGRPLEEPLREGSFVGVAPDAHIVRLADERLWAAEDRAAKAEAELRELKAKAGHFEFWHALESRLARGKRRAERMATVRGPRSAFTGLRESRVVPAAATSTYSSRHGATVPRYAGSAKSREGVHDLAGTSVSGESVGKPNPRTLLRAELDAVESRRATARWPRGGVDGTDPPSSLFRVGTALERSTHPLSAEPEWRQRRGVDARSRGDRGGDRGGGCGSFSARASTAQGTSRAGMGFILPDEQQQQQQQQGRTQQRPASSSSPCHHQASRASTPGRSGTGSRAHGSSPMIMPGRTQRSHPWLKAPMRPSTAPRPDGLSRTCFVRSSAMGCATTFGAGGSTSSVASVGNGGALAGFCHGDGGVAGAWAGSGHGDGRGAPPSWQPAARSPRSARDASLLNAREERAWREQDVNESRASRREQRLAGATFESVLNAGKHTGEAEGWR